MKRAAPVTALNDALLLSLPKEEGTLCCLPSQLPINHPTFRVFLSSFLLSPPLLSFRIPSTSFIYARSTQLNLSFVNSKTFAMLTIRGKAALMAAMMAVMFAHALGGSEYIPSQIHLTLHRARASFDPRLLTCLIDLDAFEENHELRADVAPRDGKCIAFSFSSMELWSCC